MKNYFTVLVILLISGSAYSQQKADSFTWDTQKFDKTTLMFLDVPYNKSKRDSTDYLTITVATNKLKPQPDFISIVVPDNIAEAEGMIITFSNKKVSQDNDNSISFKVNFQNRENGDCTAKIIDGYITNDQGEKTDVFKKFLEFSYAHFSFAYADGTRKSVAVPLTSFQDQYKKL